MNSQNTNLQNLTIGFIGGGNMAAALIGGLLQQGIDANFVVIEPNEASRQQLKTRFKLITHGQAHADLAQCDAIVIAVKPQQFRQAALDIAPYVGGHLVISVAAGIRCADASRWLGNHEVLIRCMPNTPALIGAGMTGLFAMPDVNPAQRQLAQTLLGAVGETLWLTQEDQLDAVTALSGSGPAYVFYFIEAMQAAGKELGLSQEAARKLASATFLGAAKLATQSEEEVGTLRERVTSKGGTTYAALTQMQSDGVDKKIIDAIHAAARRSAEMGREFGRDES